MIGVPVSPRQLRLLAELKQAPMFGAQMVLRAPEAFTTTESSGGLPVIQAGNVYTMLRRLAKRGLIEVVPNYKPPNPRAYTRKQRSRAVWYRITQHGKEVLAENQSLAMGRRPRSASAHNRMKVSTDA